MFSYYGSKSKIINYYPEPLYNTIIEPFAGSAQYAFHYWQKQVILIEKYKFIYDIWNWLINEATIDFIMSLPLFQQREKIVHLNSVVCNLMRLESNCGQSGNTFVAGKYNRWSEKNGRGRKRIADNLYKIKHWKIVYGDYSLAPNIEATWFIDPPYNNEAGSRYKCNCKEIDYEKLGKWCKDRIGQTIVCEELMADWLHFKFLCGTSGQISKSKNWNIEAMWTNVND